MNKEIVQFNAKIPADLKRKVKVDAARCGTTIDLIGAVVLRKFFKDTTADEREQLYRDAKAA